MAYTVGEVEVDVLPNAQEFNSRLAATLNPAVARLGQDIGDKLADDIAQGVRRGVERAKLDLDSLTGGDVKVQVDADTTRARAEIDSLNKDVKASVTANARGMSPLIAAGIAGGLLAGAPLVLAAAGLLFGGIAAAAVHSNAGVQAEFAHTGDMIEQTLTHAAQVTVPMFETALRRIGDAAVVLGPQFHAAFAALGAPIDSLTSGLIMLVRNVMPGLVQALQSSGPVFQGLASAMAAIGTGLGQFFSLIAQHSQAAGTAMKAIGDILGALLPILGELVGAGAELAANILPPLASALHLVADALHFLAPVLPGVLAAFVGFKVVSSLTGPMDSLAAKLTNLGGAGKTAGSALSSLSGALPIIGVALGLTGAAFQMQSQQIDGWAKALLAGGAAAVAAKTQMAQQDAAVRGLESSEGGFLSTLQRLTTPLGLVTAGHKKAAEEARAQYNAMSPLQQRTQDVTKAQNDLDLAVQKYGPSSSQARTASAHLASAQENLASQQKAVNLAVEGGTPSVHDMATALQGVADAASQAKADTNLFKLSLDALTGKTVDAASAEAAFYQAADNAKASMKGLTGSILTANGSLNTQSESGRKVQSVLFSMRDAGNLLIGTMEQQGATAAQVSAKDAQLRASFIRTAEQMGVSAGDAKHLADQIYGIPAQRTTTITANTAAAVAAIANVQTHMAMLQNKTITTTVVTNYTDGTHTVHQGVQATLGAIGGMVHAYADGGMEMKPMQGGIAQIVPPNALRVIGDRVKDDEAYIPINKDYRSQQIWTEAGRRMGMLGTATAVASKPAGPASFSGNLYLDSGVFLGTVRGIAQQEADNMLGSLADSNLYGVS